jgi:hypothetical protein
MVINSEKIRVTALIMSIILSAAITPVFGEGDPNALSTIGKSASLIELVGGVKTKSFTIWNSGSGVLDYSVSVTEGSEYFSVSPESGQSNGVWDKKSHTITVDYTAFEHGETVTGQIEITNNTNDASATIALSATETIASHVSEIAIEQGKNYEIPGDGADITFDIRLNIESDNAVDEITFTTPENNTYQLSYEEFTTSGNNTYQLLDVNDSNEPNEPKSEYIARYWTYREEFNDINGLADYGDGKYTIFILYADGNEAETSVNFGVLNEPGTIVWPVQMPTLTTPEYDELTVSPLKFEWEKCTDVNTGAIRLVLEKSCDGETDCDDISLSGESGKGAQKSSSVNLSPGTWDTELSFGRWYQGKNDDGIEFDVGKCSRSRSVFEIMKWFGTFGNVKNHPLKLTDCNGTEVTFNLTGGGWGEVQSDSGCGFENIILTDTTEKSVLSISTKKGVKTSIGSISADGDIKSITGQNVNLEGNITIEHGAGAIALSNVVGDCEITINEPNSPKITTCALAFGQIDNLILKSDTPIRSLRATDWLAGSLTAPWISTMTIKGDFGANINLSGYDSPKGTALKKAVIAGTVNENPSWVIDGNCGTIEIAASDETADVSITGDVGTVKVTGNKKTGLPAVLSGGWHFGSVKTITANTISLCEISANGAVKEKIPDIGTIKAGAIQNSTVLTETGTIDLVEINGIKNEVFCFINSSITAEHVGLAYLSYPKYSNGGTTFGLTATSIDKVTVKDSSQKIFRTGTGLDDHPIIIEDFEVRLK